MDLFAPFSFGDLTLDNRIVMAPMARARCFNERAPTELAAEYYAQRASAGLIVTEASSVSPMSVSRPNASAIFADHHAAGWKLVADAVHAAGGLIFQQIYHLGRKSDPTRMPNGAAPLAPSAIAATGEVQGANGPVSFATPRALAIDEIAEIVAQFRAAAENAMRAGMDGVELHAANAYLIQQFLCDGANQRDDRYGGSIENRVRFLREVVAAIVDVFGPQRVGVRLSPHASGDGIGDSDPAALFGHAASVLDAFGVAYIHLVEAASPGLRQSPPPGAAPLMPVVRGAYSGALIVNGGYDRDSGNAIIASGAADCVAFATPFIANPDLVERYRRGAALNEPDLSTYYSGGAKGYTDYPSLQPV